MYPTIRPASFREAIAPTRRRPEGVGGLFHEFTVAESAQIVYVAAKEMLRVLTNSEITLNRGLVFPV